MDKIKTLSGLLLVLLIIVTGFGYMQHKENQKYEQLLSMQLTNNLARMSHAAAQCESLLENVIYAGDINYKQAERLQNYYLSFAESADSINSLSQVIYPTGEYNPEYVEKAASDIHYYLNREFAEKLQEGKTIELGDAQLNKLQNIQALNHMWVTKIKDHFGVLHIMKREGIKEKYLDNGINMQEWRALMYELTQICIENRGYYQNLFD